MPNRAIALAAGTFVALGVSAGAALAGPPGAGGSAPVHEVNVDANGLIRVHEQGTVMSQVTNFPLDPGGSLSVSGNVACTGTVGATQSGTWSVGLDAGASAHLSNIDNATSGLAYDSDGNLKVTMAGSGSPADPSAADRSPFGHNPFTAFPASTDVQVNAGTTARVTSYFVQAIEGEINVWFMRSGSPAFGFRVTAGQSATAALAHAIVTDAWRFECGPSSNCVMFYSAAGY